MDVVQHCTVYLSGSQSSLVFMPDKGKAWTPRQNMMSPNSGQEPVYWLYNRLGAAHIVDFIVLTSVYWIDNSLGKCPNLPQETSKD